MTNEELSTYLSEQFGQAEVKQGTQYIEILVKAEELHKVAESLRNSPKTAFDYMVCLSGVDYADHMCVVYHLESTSLKHFLVLKVKTEGRENPAIDTLSDLWPTAEFHEREVYDLLGVKFNNHPDLRRLFLDDSWGFPLRKDYVDEIHVVER